MRFMKFLFSMFLVCAVTIGWNFKAEALTVRGYAPIVKGNEDQARIWAIRNAHTMAFAITEDVPTDDLPRIIRFTVLDDILDNRSDDYITVNKMIKDRSEGEYYAVEMDVTVDKERLRETARSLRDQVKEVNGNPNRDKIQVSIVDKTKDGYVFDNMITYYIGTKFNVTGYAYDSNSEVTDCLIKNATDKNFGDKVRDFAIMDRNNEVVYFYGVLEKKSVEKLPNGLYKVVAHLNFNSGVFEDPSITSKLDTDLTGYAETPEIAGGLVRVRGAAMAVDAFNTRIMTELDDIELQSVD